MGDMFQDCTSEHAYGEVERGLWDKKDKNDNDLR